MANKRLFNTKSLFTIFGALLLIYYFYNFAFFSGAVCETRDAELQNEISALKNEITAKENRIKQLLEVPLEFPAASSTTSSQSVIPVIIFTYNRANYLKRTLEAVTKYAPENVLIIVSQDGTQNDVAEVARSFPEVLHIQNIFRGIPKKERPSDRESYYYISQHYEFGLTTVFDRMHFDSVIILEDDLEIAPDFFEYFISLLPLLQTDPTLFCVSAWNDNGLARFVQDPKAVYRSNFFPGLGWMTTKAYWNEVKDRWPGGFWDDWVREPPQRRNRDCIRPEISRTYTFGAQGSSDGQFFDQYLKHIVLNDEKVDWPTPPENPADAWPNLRKDEYDSNLKKELASAKRITSIQDISKYSGETLVLPYRDFNHFVGYATSLGIMNDEKAGIPRTAYNGIVTIRSNSNVVHIAPNNQIN